jgi:hypothetical protein
MSKKNSPLKAEKKSQAEDLVNESNPGFQILRFGYGAPTNVVTFKDSAYNFCR